MVTALRAIIVLAIAVQFILDGTAGAIRQFEVGP
jgi:small neutral amino acid transporter SnatA (MarC family)